MSTSHQPSAGHAMRDADLPRRPIVVTAHPGGRWPGIELPPTWFEHDGLPARSVASELPAKGDHPAIVEGVRRMAIAIREAAAAAHAAGEHPVLIGGDHSLAMGSIAAAVATHPRLAIIWIDAHADFNTMDTSPTKNPHGMPLAAACGLGDERLTSLFTRHVSPRDVVLIAARDIDHEEQKLLDQQGIWAVGMAELRELGIAGLTARIAERFAGVPVHLSYDFDSISSEFFSATGTPVAGGLLPDEAELLVRSLANSTLHFVSSDWVEFDPRHETAPEAAKLVRRVYRAFHG